MSKVAGRKPVVAWVVSLVCLGILGTIVIVSIPIWPDVVQLIGSWWESVAPFRG